MNLNFFYKSFIQNQLKLSTFLNHNTLARNANGIIFQGASMKKRALKRHVPNDYWRETSIYMCSRQFFGVL